MECASRNSRNIVHVKLFDSIRTKNDKTIFTYNTPIKCYLIVNKLYILHVIWLKRILNRSLLKASEHQDQNWNEEKHCCVHEKYSLHKLTNKTMEIDNSIHFWRMHKSTTIIYVKNKYAWPKCSHMTSSIRGKKPWHLSSGALFFTPARALFSKVTNSFRTRKVMIASKSQILWLQSCLHMNTSSILCFYIQIN